MASSGLSFRVGITSPADHLAHVTVEIPTAGLGATVELAMAAWCPGSYLVRDYARMVRDLRVRGDDGQPRAATKRDKQTWVIEVAGAATLTVDYAVFGHELSVRTNHIDDSHAFLHGPATFVYVEALRAEPVTITLEAPPTWALATPLAGGELGPSAAGRTLRAASIDALFDAPIHLGHTDARSFAVAGADFELAVWGPVHDGPFSLDKLALDLAAIAADHAQRVGGEPVAMPFDRYTFLLMLAPDAYGGLEHAAGSANLFHPGAFTTRKHYEALLELLSHEFFHAWNGKRIAPPALLAFDYTREAYTRCLWVMEGLTSHYDRFALVTSGRVTPRSFLDKILDDWSRLVATPGRHRASLEDSSFDAWIKLYKPDESNLNTTVSYYLKGGLVALGLDLEIRRRTEGARSLDDVLRRLWQRYGARGVPHPEDVLPDFAEASGLDLGDSFARYVRGVEDPPLVAELAAVGLELRAVADPGITVDGAAPAQLGAIVSGLRITGVPDDSPAALAGLAVGDELIAIDDWRVSSDGDVRAALTARGPGARVELALFRRGRLLRRIAHPVAVPPSRFEIVARAEPDDAARAAYRAWLGEALPAGETLAVAVTTTRTI